MSYLASDLLTKETGRFKLLVPSLFMLPMESYYIMKPKVIYRVETYKQKGIYDSGLWVRIPSRYSGARDDSHPAPYEDLGICDKWSEVEHEWHFGFGSLNQLKKWLNRASIRWEAREIGLRIGIYEIDDLDSVAIGKTQAIFDMKKARRVEEMSLIDEKLGKPFVPTQEDISQMEEEMRIICRSCDENAEGLNYVL